MTALCLAAAGCIFYAIRSSDDEVVPAPSIGTITQGSVETARISRIPWNEIDAIYRVAPRPETSRQSPDSKSQWPDLEKTVGADLKKESLWANYKGRIVEWEGEVVEVKHGSAMTTLGIKMRDSNTTRKDILLALKKTKTESAKAKKLKSGDRLKFRGRLRSWGVVVQFAMDQGEILE
ncbi:MAG: hypothetical protein ACI9R3_003026 [Verrucomicrobiales bacterium]|jgi:hypothetical protein